MHAPAVRRTVAPPPPPSPLAWWERQEGDPATGAGARVGLGLPGLGRVVVSADGVEVLAPDEVALDGTWGVLGEWALAQWWSSKDHWVVRGTAVARGDDAVVLTGGSRCGASLLALAMTARGWAVVADGVVAVDRDGVVRAGDPGVVIDASAAAPLPADRVTRLPTTRGRVRVSAPGHDDAAVAGIVLLTKSQRARRLAIARVEDDEVLRRSLLSLTVRPDLPAPLVEPPVGVPSWQVQRPEELTAVDLAATLPGPLAAALDDALPLSWGALR